MSDLISKEVVQNALIERISKLNSKGEIRIARELTKCKRYIDSITQFANNAGKLIDTKYEGYGYVPLERYKCSNCEKGFPDNDYNFCPNCGIRFHKEESHE